MIKTGICSVTMRHLKVAEVVTLAAQAGLEAIEWGGDVHVPSGDLSVAQNARRLTEGAGLTISSYGSYYQGVAESGEAMPFDEVLATTLALGAPTVRIWAGGLSSATAESTYRLKLIDTLRRVATEAAQQGVRVALEFHANTLTDSNAEAQALLAAVGHPNLYLYWQPIYWLNDEEYRWEGLRQLAPYVLNLHVFHWVFTPGGVSWGESINRRPLAEGMAEWADYLAVPLNPMNEHYALLEFVRHNEPAQVLADAATLRSWCATMG